MVDPDSVRCARRFVRGTSGTRSGPSAALAALSFARFPLILKSTTKIEKVAHFTKKGSEAWRHFQPSGFAALGDTSIHAIGHACDRVGGGAAACRAGMSSNRNGDGWLRFRLG